ncbi:MAG: hypothetical protein HY608_04415, partial [Planctomycetes bacterium]|nr:hypothetical protein [Planctomycetota bacterium]
RGPVVVTSETALPASLEPFTLRIPPEQFHHVLAFADRCVGESATVASEAAVLGVPAIYVARTGRGYVSEEEERYGLARWCRTASAAHAVLDAWDRDGDLKPLWAGRRARMLREKVDVTTWMMENVFRPCAAS